jgi:DNA-binding MarR family transcriptional regulator
MSTLEEKASELMIQIHEIMRRYRSRKRDFVKGAEAELNHSEIDALLWLGMEGDSTMSQLAKEIVHSVSSATMTIDRLVQKGIVTREHSSTDRRVVMIRLTAEGERIYKVINETFMEATRTMLGSLTEKEQDTFLLLYRKIASSM